MEISEARQRDSGARLCFCMEWILQHDPCARKCESVCVLGGDGEEEEGRNRGLSM